MGVRYVVSVDSVDGLKSLGNILWYFEGYGNTLIVSTVLKNIAPFGFLENSVEDKCYA